MFELVLPLTVGAAFVAAGLGTYVVATGSSDRRRMAQLIGGQTAPANTDIREEVLARPFLDRVAFPLVAGLGRLGRKFSPLDLRPRLVRKLTLAGNPKGLDADRMAAFKILAGGLGTVGGIALTRVLGTGGMLTIAGTVLFGLMGFVLPSAMLAQSGAKRQAAIRRSLPDTIDLLTISVEAGLGFDAALAEVTRSVPGPLSEEIGRMLQEINLGVSRVEALRHMADRTDVRELGAFVLAMVQAELFGVSIAKVLRSQSKELRVKRRQAAETLAQKVPVKLLFPLIFCVLPALFVVILGPGAIKLLQGFFGVSP